MEWNKEKCKEEALKYRLRKNFHNHSTIAYLVAWRNNWLSELCQHMDDQATVNIKWTKAMCAIEAKKYNYRSRFQSSNGYAYLAAWKNGWLDEICQHMKAATKWTKEACLKEAQKYQSKKEFISSNRSAYNIACRNGWLSEVCSHMG